MSTEGTAKENEYMYSSTSEEVETRRLKSLNDTHNPHTLLYLKPYLKKTGIKILELGCGSGQLAAEVMGCVDNSSHYIGVDRDVSQIEHSLATLKSYKENVEVIQLDITTGLNSLKEKGPFDLIYCRWLLVHLPNEIREDVLRNIIAFLAEDGVFICDECDNRSVKFQANGISEPTAPYEQATQIWSVLSIALMQMLKNDLELTQDKISHFLASAAGSNEGVKIEGQYQVTLKGLNQKRLIADGYRSSSSTLFKAYQKPIEPIIEIFDQCAEDDGLDALFLTQNVVSYRRK